MADYGSVPSPTEKFRRPTLPFFITSPRLFTNFASKPFFEAESAAMSPTSILDAKPFSGLRNPFRPDSPKTPTEPNKRNWKTLDSRHIGLGIVDSFIDEKSDPKTPNPESRMVLFGSQLKIHIPSPPPSPLDPCRKEREPQLGSSSSSSLLRSPSVKQLGSDPESPNRVFAGSLSASEMELSEDYTCVIAHGPNPRTTHIFDDCIIESYNGVGSYYARKKRNGFMGERCSFPSQSFLSFCHSCKKNIGQGKDIYMYRGEKAFCSQECRYQEMLMEEEMEEVASDDALTFS